MKKGNLPKKTFTDLQNKLDDQSAIIAVIGLGYVGLPLAVEFVLKGYRTIGIDTDPKKISSLSKGKNYIADISDDHWKKVKDSKRFSAQLDNHGLEKADVIFICVPTPFSANKEPDISYIISATKQIADKLRIGQSIILKSTTFPNTTEGYVFPILQQTKLTVGKDYYLAFSPERIDPGNTKWHTGNTPVVVGGVTESCTKISAHAIQKIVKHVHQVSGPKVAEMEKLLENIFRSVNIALVNELAMMCDRVGGINVWEVIEAAGTKPFGFMPFYPGPGIGGHCILIDPYYLSWYAKAYDFHSDFIELAAKTNEFMPFYVRDMILKEIASIGKPLHKTKILFLGIAFKKNVDDTRHSPAIRVIELLTETGVTNLAYNDPFVPNVSIHGKKYSSIPLTETEIKKYDLVIITTDHTTYNIPFITKHASRIIDTRNATKGKSLKKIVTIGDGK